MDGIDILTVNTPLKVIEPKVVVNLQDEQISLHEAPQAAQLMSEQKLSFDVLEEIGDAFPEIYPETVRQRLAMLYGVPATTSGVLIEGRDNVDYFTMVKFAEVVEYEKEICDMMMNKKNRTFHRQIIDMCLPMICLLSGRK